MKWRAAPLTARWTAIALGLLAYGLYTGFLTPRQITTDEAWFLQVTRRMLSGETLYRDIFFGVTPLSAYLTAALAGVFGVELAVVKGVMAAAFAANTLLACRIARQLGLPDRVLALVILAQVAYVPSWIPGAGSPYTPLAYVLFLASFSCFLSWRERAVAGAGGPEAGARLATWSLAAAGCLGGLAFAVKQTMGIYVLAGLGLAVLANYRQARMKPPDLLRHWVVVTLAWAAPTIVLLMPVWTSGGAARFLDYAFLNKGAYLQYGQISYADALSAWWRQLLPPWSLTQLMIVYQQLQLLLPFPAFAGLCVVLARGPGRALPMTVLVLTAAGFADVFPRVSTAHTSCTIALLVVAAAWAWRQLGLSLPGRAYWPAAAGIVLWLLGGLLFLAGYPLWSLTLGGYQISDLPHLRGAALPAPILAALRSDSAGLRANAGADSLFIVNPGAATYYLISGLHNSTPFDYPLVTAFGLTGEADVVRALKDGRLPLVCLTVPDANYLRPVVLETYILENMEAVGQAGPCVLFRARR